MENLVSRLQESHAAGPAMNNNEHIVISNSKQDSSYHTELANVKLYVPTLTVYTSSGKCSNYKEAGLSINWQ